MEGENRRDRLNRLQLERLSRPPEAGWTAWTKRAVDAWERFTAGSSWEKGFFVGAIVLIAALAIGALGLLVTNAIGGSGGERKQAAAGGVRATATPVQAPATPTAIVIAVPGLPTAVPTDRADCESIHNSGPQSDSERAFFEEYCVTPTPEPPGSGGPGGPPPPPPPTEPPPPAGFTAGDAIGAAVYWITHSAPEAYTTDASACNALQTGDHWVVTCSARLAGCQGSVCDRTVSVCVFPDPFAVRPANEC